MGHYEGQQKIQWKSEPTWWEPLHAEVLRGPERAEGEDAADLSRAEKEKEKRQREAFVDVLDILGDRRNRNDMLLRWAQRLRGKSSPWQNV